MSTANFLILSALTRIGKNSPLKPAKAEDIQAGFASLEVYLQQLTTQNIFLRTKPIRSFSDEAEEPLDTRNALINNLAIEISTNYDNGQDIVSDSLRRNAASGMAFMKKWYTVDPTPLRKISSTAPIGAGNERGRYTRDSRKHFGPFRTLTEPVPTENDPTSNT